MKIKDEIRFDNSNKLSHRFFIIANDKIESLKEGLFNYPLSLILGNVYEN